MGQGLAEHAQAFDHQAQGRTSRRPGQVQDQRFRRLVILRQLQHALFGIEQQAVAVHRDSVGFAQIKKVTCIEGGGRLLGVADRLEHAKNRGNWPTQAFLDGKSAAQHLRATAPAGNKPDADFHQTDGCFRMRLNRRAMQRDFAAAPQHKTRCRRHGRERSKAQRVIGFMPLPD